MNHFTKVRERKSIEEARHKIGKKSLYLVKGEKYKDYLKEFEKKRYFTELDRFKFNR